MTPPKVSTVISRDPATIDQIAEAYPSLLERTEWINPYFSPQWLRPWWNRQKQDRAPLFFLAEGEDGTLLGYWPFVERPGLLGSKGLWPFVYDEANYHFPTCSASVAPLLVDSLSQLVGTFLCLVAPNSRVLLGCLYKWAHGNECALECSAVCPEIFLN